MTEIRDQTLTGAVTLDGARFINCTFDDVEMTYSGGVQPAFVQCRFNAVKFTFAGPAANTVVFLRSMAGPETGMRQIVQSMLPELAG